MAVSIVSKTQGENTDLLSSFSTAPITTVTGRLYIMSVQLIHFPEYTGSDITGITTAGGVTWNRGAVSYLNAAYPIEIWWGYCTAGATGVTWNVASGTTPSQYSSRVYIINEATGTGNTGVVIQSGTNETTTSPISATLSAFASPFNAAFEFNIAMGQGDQTITVEAGYVQCGVAPMSIFNVLCKTGYFAGSDTSPSYSFTGGNVPTGHILAVEIKSDGLGGMQPNSLMLMGCGI